MGRTVIEKIFVDHTADEVAPGRVIWLELDLRSARDFAGANVVKRFREAYPGERVADPGKTFFTFDLNAPPNTIAYAENQRVCRAFAREQGIKVYDVDAGIGTHVLMEEGLVLPGHTAVGTDSHFNILGAVGAFGQGMGDVDIAFAFRYGRTWFEVPPTMKVVLRGRYEYPTTAKDLVLFLVGKLGARGALGRAVEIYGEAVEALDMAGRITLCSMATEMGAISAFLPPSDGLWSFLEETTGKRDHPYPTADPDAEYVQELEFDVSGLKPKIAAPPRPDNVYDVSELEGERVDAVFVGSCTNGRYEDIRLVAEILKGRKVAKGVILTVVPATRRVWGRLLREGWLQVLHDAGAIISHPRCSGCAQGHLGMTGEGEVQLSTANRNFPGKQGKGRTYLCSPATAAATALFGRITSPEHL